MNLPDDMITSRHAVICDVLRAWEEQSGNKVLLAVEGGSRGHGFGSPTSDYDVRIIYQEPLERTLRLFPGKETVTVKRKDLPFEPGFDMEMSGWNLQTSLRLALASNPQVAEFAKKSASRDPRLAYISDSEFLDSLLGVVTAMSPRRAFHNLRGLAKVNLLKEIGLDQQPKLKIYLHTAQALLKAQWIADNPETPGDFPLNFSDLLSESSVELNVRAELQAALQAKVEAADSQVRARNTVLDRWVEHEVARLEVLAASVPDRHIEQEMAEAIWFQACSPFICDGAASRVTAEAEAAYP